jgi:hypothetical protein
MKKILLNIILIISCITIYAQSEDCDCPNYVSNDTIFDEHLSSLFFVDEYRNNNKQFYGTWAEGDVVLNNGNTVYNCQLRYSGYLDELLNMRTEDYTMGVVYKKSVASFTLKNQVTGTKRFEKISVRQLLSNDYTDIYMQVLAEGTVSLYVQHKVVLLKNTGEMYPKDIYYVAYKGNLTSIAKRRHSFLKTLTDETDRQRMRSILRSNWLSVRNEAEFVKAIELFNQNN